jgi:hypothetical protein
MASNRRHITKRVTPTYPCAARPIGIGGPVEIDVTVDPHEKATKAKALSENTVLALAAVDAARG